MVFKYPRENYINSRSNTKESTDIIFHSCEWGGISKEKNYIIGSSITVQVFDIHNFGRLFYF